ncbi:MAG: IS110 family transposase [Rhodospirillales bacterium]|nr:IS110 family transposase [Rhodospirillales bacterium]
MEQIIRIGMDTSKHVFQLHGVDAGEQVVLRRRLRRKEVVAFFAEQAPLEIGIEACAGSHHWARVLEALGHRVKLMAPQHVKPYVKRGKNDAADAEALCEAMSRPTMRFVAAKTRENQAALMLAGTRDRLIRTRTQLSNSIRGYAAEFGLVAAKGLDKIEPLLARIEADETLPVLARELFKDHSTAGKVRLGVSTRAGDEALRSLLVVGATSMVKQAQRGTAGVSPWLIDLVGRKPPKLAAVALANKNARIAWKLMASGESYDAGRTRPAPGSIPSKAA